MWCSARIQKYCSARIRALWHLYVITSTWFFSHIRFTHVNVYKMHVYVQFYTYMSPCIFVYVQLHQIIYKIFTSLHTWFVSSLRSAPLREKSCTYTKPKFSYTISSFRIREKVRLYEVVPLRSKIPYWWSTCLPWVEKSICEVDYLILYIVLWLQPLRGHSFHLKSWKSEKINLKIHVLIRCQWTHQTQSFLSFFSS